MKRTKQFQRLTAVLCALALTLTLSPAVFAAGETPLVSNNINRHVGVPKVFSYLYANPRGGLTRVELMPGGENWIVGSNGSTQVTYDPGRIVVEDYSSSYQFVSSRTIAEELKGCWGFFHGQQYNFLIFGQKNPAESDSVEVIRVAKYSHDWQRLGQASVKAVDIREPFRSGAVRCAEADGQLYIHTARTMYKSSDGKNHQSNFTLSVRESDMSYEVISSGYVSHSFDQYILIDQQKQLAMLDLGDAYPRAVALFAKGKQYEIHEIPGPLGQNSTGVNLGGLAETANGYVAAYDRGELPKMSDGSTYTGPNALYGGQSHAYLAYVDKSTMAVNTVRLTAERGISGVVLASYGLDGGFAMWNTRTGTDKRKNKIDEKLYYVSYDANGNVGQVKVGSAPLSDCAPILYNGRLVWYVTDNSAPKFYGLDGNGVERLDANTKPSAAPLTSSAAVTPSAAPGTGLSA